MRWGMSYWQKTGLIVLPQALKLVIPPTMNTFIGLFKDTTLIIMISMFDFLGTIRLASSDPIWRPYYVEGLVFAAIIYFIMCYAMASYARHLEHKLDTGTGPRRIADQHLAHTRCSVPSAAPGGAISAGVADPFQAEPAKAHAAALARS